MGEYLSFRKLVTPLLVQVVFWAAVIINTIDAFFFTSSFFDGLFRFIVGPIVIRIICEGLIVLFEINNTLTEIRDNQLVASTAPPVAPPPAAPSVTPAASPTPPVV